VTRGPPNQARGLAMQGYAAATNHQMVVIAGSWGKPARGDERDVAGHRQESW
jgi:hypothetical protein